MSLDFLNLGPTYTNHVLFCVSWHEKQGPTKIIGINEGLEDQRGESVLKNWLKLTYAWAGHISSSRMYFFCISHHTHFMLVPLEWSCKYTLKTLHSLRIR